VGIAGIDRATDLFVGYLALDAVCGGVVGEASPPGESASK
jgi:hypothetical protein